MPVTMEYSFSCDNYKMVSFDVHKDGKSGSYVEHIEYQAKQPNLSRTDIRYSFSNYLQPEKAAGIIRSAVPGLGLRLPW
ncbi:hypothetical protein [Candidatus Coxiella mudrowiae]|uniref:hypothetical protein n=1 Tax=Candidatus Coxiella mudrowiae TaxID=2054173 RepID=UPI0006623C3A|nr:hypothetical protein [Candidatus Coxiella mudrowiae]